MASNWSSEKEATPEIQEICNRMKPFAEGSVGLTFSVFIAKQYIFQFNEDTHKMKYSIRVQGQDYYIHLEVAKSPVEELKFIACLLPRTADDPLPHF
ncbi:cystatin-B [Misgurnus anguillicaudatus]|uniref:cystatin-B n=1 Tax=Misgurnus anguillicaudatus TaxID=75329 RepID=UPI003CCFBB56